MEKKILRNIAFAGFAFAVASYPNNANCSTPNDCPHPAACANKYWGTTCGFLYNFISGQRYGVLVTCNANDCKNLHNTWSVSPESVFWQGGQDFDEVQQNPACWADWTQFPKKRSANELGGPRFS